MKTKYWPGIFSIILIVLPLRINAQCKSNCILQSRLNDQECNLEKTPLSRCSFLAHYEKSDLKLNTEYRELIKKINKIDIDILRKNQREWLKWRLEKCEEVDESSACDNGMCAGVDHDTCIVTLTDQRIKEIVKYKDDIPSGRVNGFSFSKEYKE